MWVVGKNNPLDAFHAGGCSDHSYRASRGPRFEHSTAFGQEFPIKMPTPTPALDHPLGGHEWSGNCDYKPRTIEAKSPGGFDDVSQKCTAEAMGVKKP